MNTSNITTIQGTSAINFIQSDKFKDLFLVVPSARSIFSSNFTYSQNSDGSFAPSTSTESVLNATSLMNALSSSSCSAYSGSANDLFRHSFPITARHNVFSSAHRTRFRNLYTKDFQNLPMFQVYAVFIDRKTGRPVPHFIKTEQEYLFLSSPFKDSSGNVILDSDNTSWFNIYEGEPSSSSSIPTTDASGLTAPSGYDVQLFGKIRAEVSQRLGVSCIRSKLGQDEFYLDNTIILSSSISGPVEYITHRNEGNGTVYGGSSNFAAYWDKANSKLEPTPVPFPVGSTRIGRVPLTAPVTSMNLDERVYTIQQEVQALQFHQSELSSRGFLPGRVVDAESEGFYPMVYAIIWDNGTTDNGPNLMYMLYKSKPALTQLPVALAKEPTLEDFIMFEDPDADKINVNFIQRKLFAYKQHINILEEYSSTPWGVPSSQLGELAYIMTLPGSVVIHRRTNNSSVNTSKKLQVQLMNMFMPNANVGERMLQLYCRCLDEKVNSLLVDSIENVSDDARFVYQAHKFLDSKGMITQGEPTQTNRAIAAAIDNLLKQSAVRELFLLEFDSKNPGLLNPYTNLRDALVNFNGKPGPVCFLVDMTFESDLPSSSYQILRVPLIFSFS